MTSIEPPAPAGTKYDGDPRFEALVFGWAASTELWNGEKPGAAAHDRSELAGYFEQYLEQRADEPQRRITPQRVLDAMRSVDHALVNRTGIEPSAALVLRDFARKHQGGSQ